MQCHVDLLQTDLPEWPWGWGGQPDDAGGGRGAVGGSPCGWGYVEGNAKKR